jgi:hypothetical protein
MICDECGRDSADGTGREWVAATRESGGSYQTATALVMSTLYGGFTPVEAFLCANCYGPRAERVRRVSLLTFFGGLAFGVLSLAVSYNIAFWACFVPRNIAPELPAWQIIVGLVAAVVAYVTLKFAVWEELSLGVMWRPGGEREARDVLHSYALTKAKAASRDTILLPEYVEATQRRQYPD